MSLGPGWLGGGCHVELGGDGTGHMSQGPGGLEVVVKIDWEVNVLVIWVGGTGSADRVL